MPRSGTTLLEQIVSRHPRVGAGGELPFWGERAEAFARAGAAGLGDAFAASAKSDYLELLNRLAPGKDRVTDKLPGNFIWLGLIHLFFPMRAFCTRGATRSILACPITSRISPTGWNSSASVATSPITIAAIRS